MVNQRNAKSSIGKKAFGGIASTLIMFIAIIGVTTGMVMVFQNFFLETKDTLVAQQEKTNTKLKTFVDITHVYYDGAADSLRVYVKNTGSVELKTQYIDLFVDGQYGSGLTPYYAGTSTEVDILKQTQTMYIDFNVVLAAGSHNVKIVTGHGVNDDADFNVQ